MIVRIIPRLDIKGPNLVKGVHLEGLRVLGRPEHFARRYYEEGADELLFMDVVASLYERNSLHDIIARTAREVFVPLCVGGGLRSIDDIRSVLRAGADKVAVNTAAIRRPEFLRQAARHFGSSTIVVSIEAIRQQDGSWEAFTDNGRERTGVNAVTWALQAAELGAGELIVTSIDKEGTGRGYDLELTRQVSKAVSVPVIASGGAGTSAHVADALESGASAVAVASLLHYHTARVLPLAENEIAPEVNLAHLRTGKGRGRIDDLSLSDLKAALETRGLQSRPLEGEFIRA